MSRAPRLALVAAFALSIGACDEAAPIVSELSEDYALSRLSLDPITEIGALLGEDPSLAAAFGIRFEDASCDGVLPILVHLEGERVGSRGQGELSMAVGALDSGGACDGTGAFAIVAGVVDGEPIVKGPLFVEGGTAEAHLPLATINPVLSFLPTWWRVTAEQRQGGDRFSDGEASAPWLPAHLASTDSTRTAGITLLDDLVGLGAQPDLDVDRDGLETFADEDGDGRVDACFDGDGARIDGAECAMDPRIVDAFELVLRFRLVPVRVVP